MGGGAHHGHEAIQGRGYHQEQPLRHHVRAERLAHREQHALGMPCVRGGERSERDGERRVGMDGCVGIGMDALGSTCAFDAVRWQVAVAIISPPQCPHRWICHLGTARDERAVEGFSCWGQGWLRFGNAKP
jgi:hypothetical protein